MVTGRARHSPSNGGVERFNRTIQLKIRAWLQENGSKDWPLASQFAMWQYNTSVHRSINKVCTETVLIMIHYTWVETQMTEIGHQPEMFVLHFIICLGSKPRIGALPPAYLCQVPYQAVFGQLPRAGITSLKLSKALMQRLQTEEQLNEELRLAPGTTIEDYLSKAPDGSGDDCGAGDNNHGNPDGEAEEHRSPELPHDCITPSPIQQFRECYKSNCCTPTMLQIYCML